MDPVQLQAASIGILGGTFNPPHDGHLRLARHALGELKLDHVLLVPSHTPPHKPVQADSATPEQRLAMCELAVADLDGVSACALEVLRGGASYTVDTLSEVHDARPDADLTLIMGADVALTLPSWRRPGSLLELAHIAVARREGSESGGEELARLVEGLARDGARMSILEMPPIEVSSSLVRERAAAGLPIDGLVPQAVADYIEEHRLYKGRKR
jgi:nicotinate-nucleotide adenylyltransferase